MIDIIQEILKLGNNTDRVLRITTLLQKTAEPGCIVEIGGGVGDLTYHLTRYGHVVVVDPFETEWDNMPESYGKPYPLKQFMATMNGQCHFTVIQKSSQHPDVPQLLRVHCPIAFAFIDGLQYKDAVLSDLKMMEKLDVRMMAVDDIWRSTGISQVPQAVDEFLVSAPYRLFASRNSREGYLIRT